MQSTNRDLFEEPGSTGLQTHIDAFEGWLAAREEFGAIREQSSVAVYRSMWAALSAWCVGRGLHLDALKRTTSRPTCFLAVALFRLPKSKAFTGPVARAL
jgi:hypothetical protein